MSLPEIPNSMQLAAAEELRKAGLWALYTARFGAFWALWCGP